MEFGNVPMNNYAQEQHWQGEIQGQFVQADFQGQVLGEILDDEDNMQNWEEGQGNLEGEFPGNAEAAQYWGAGAGELQGELNGAPWAMGEDNHVQNVPIAENDDQMPPMGEFDGIHMPIPIPIPVAIPEVAAEDPAVYKDWQAPMPASSVLMVPQTPMNWDGLDFPLMEDPTGMSMAPPMAPTSMAMAPPMAPVMCPMTPVMGPASYTMAPPMEPMGYMITTVVAPLTPAMAPLTPAMVPLTPAIAALTPVINPLSPMVVLPAGQVYQLVGDNYSGLAVIPADMVGRRVI